MVPFQVDSYQNTQTRESLSVDYITCLMKNGLLAAGTFSAGPRCAKEVQLKNWNVIEQCANTTEGSKLLQHHGETTHALRPELTNVPWINFNHVNLQKCFPFARDVWRFFVSLKHGLNIHFAATRR